MARTVRPCSTTKWRRTSLRIPTRCVRGLRRRLRWRGGREPSGPGAAAPNKRLKLTGDGRLKGSGVLCPWRGTDCRPLLLRRRAGRPQLKRDPLGRVHPAMQASRTVVTFQSGVFNTTERRPYFINDACYGDDVARWIISELHLRGIPSDPEPGQEDFGWYVTYRPGQ